jgi:ribA/ribD-fused uncharacterized protein
MNYLEVSLECGSLLHLRGLDGSVRQTKEAVMSTMSVSPPGDTHDRIGPFDGRWEFLSNFHPSPITVTFDNITMSGATVEHVFQAAKTSDSAERATILSAPSPYKAKRLGKRTKHLRADWDDVCRDVMLACVSEKFSTQTDLAQLLLATGDRRLVELNRFHDVRWGRCVGTCWRGPHEEFGTNWLGTILGQVRGELGATSR